MNTRRAFLSMAVLGWSIVLVASDEELRRVWSAPNIPVRQRATAVNQAFTNGTPMSVIVAALGTNYTRFFSSATVWMGPGPEPRKTKGLIYCYGEDAVIINTTAGISEDPLTAIFTGAGYSIPVGQLTQTTNRIQIGQPGGPTNGSQPSRLETNQKPSAAGSRR